MNKQVDIKKYLKRQIAGYPQLAELIMSEPDEISTEGFFELSRILRILDHTEKQRNLDSSKHNNKQVRR